MRLSALNSTPVALSTSAPRRPESVGEPEYLPFESFQSMGKGMAAGAGIGAVVSVGLAAAQQGNALLYVAVPVAAALVGGVAGFLTQHAQSQAEGSSPTQPLPPQPAAPGVDEFRIRGSESSEIRGLGQISQGLIQDEKGEFGRMEWMIALLGAHEEA